MTEPDPDPQEPTTPCPPWCRLHMDGRHHGELELASTEKGYHIYTRPLDYGDSKVGLEVVVARENGDHTIRIEIDPDEVLHSAWMADLRRSLAALENGATIDGDE